MNTSKRCSKCQVEKDLGEFSNDPHHTDGKRSECKKCAYEIAKIYKKKNLESIKIKQHAYYIKHKERLIQSVLNWRAENPDKVRQYSKTSRLKNPEPSRRAVAKWTKSHPSYRQQWAENNRHKAIEYMETRRALKAGSYGRITGEEFISLCDYYGNICLRCKRADAKLTLDHIVPLSQGGSHTLDNAQPLCKSCNSKKYTSTIDYRPTVWEQL